MLSRALILKTSALPPVERLVRRSFLFRGLVKRFIAGDTLEQALAVCEDLVAKGFHTSLDLLGENVKSIDEAMASKNAYIQMLETMAKSPCAPKSNISIKLTQCGFDQGDELAERNYREVLTRAEELGGFFVRVDMEASPYTERTIQIIKNVWPDHKNSGTVVQSMLHRTPQDVDLMIELGIRTRIVKGAYLEPSTVAYASKAKVDEAFVTEAKKLLLKGNYPAIATHDEKIIDVLKDFVRENKIPNERFEFQMIYGVRRDLQDKLLAEGYNVRIYVPFGNSWYPYFTRRLAERPANVMFILKSLFKP